MCVRPSSAAFEVRSEALVRLLRTVLDEASALVAAGPIGERSAALKETIDRLQREAESIAPDFPSGNLRNGVARG